ncbi:MAG: hypothetical protein AAB955_03265 [Patescibacteria group bacterium]
MTLFTDPIDPNDSVPRQDHSGAELLVDCMLGMAALFAAIWAASSV